MRPCLRCKNPGCAARGSSELNYEGSAITCYGFEPITNADRIRAMTDEELAEFVNDAEFGFLDRPGMCDVCDHYLVKACLDCWLDWLRQEAST